LILVIPLFAGAVPVIAANLVNNSFVRIDSPKDGATISGSSVTIQVSYLWDTNWEDPPSISNLWRLDISCQLYDSDIIPSSQYKNYSTFESYMDITGPGGGGGSLGVNLSGYPAGTYMVFASLMGPAKFAASNAKFTARETATTFFHYDGKGSAVPVTNSDGTVTTTDGGGTNPIIPIAIVAGALGLLGLLARNVMVKSKGKTPVKTTPENKTAPPSGPSKQSDPRIREAENNLIKARKNKALFDRWTKIRNAVYNDDRLYDFVDKARGSIIGANGEINEANLNRLEFNLKNWIKRDVIAPQMPDYTGSDVMADTVRQASGNIFIRLGAAYLSGGYSEMVLNPISAVSNMGHNIAQGDSATWAVTKGFAQSGFELALGEAGRVIKPLADYAKTQYAWSKLGQAGANLKSELSTVSQLAKQTEGQLTRNSFMKSTEVAKTGDSALYKLTSAEKEALRLNNDDALRELMAKNHELVPGDVKEVMGVAKQKVYQQARNDAANEVMNQMTKDGVNTADKSFFIQQTGTHAQPGNPGWNSVKSDFDHTVDFGSSKYNQLYENKFNSSLEGQGTSAKAMDANVYGEGTSSRGAYTGGAKKFVEHYNETSGTDVMVRNVDGATKITTETPQTSTSLLSKMNQNDVKTASDNYKTFFEKDMAKGGDLKNQILNGSKTVSRDAGAHGVQSVQHIQNTGKYTYDPPPAAKVADLIKERGFSVPDAMQKVGYKGNQQQLLNDFKTIMGR
jgi:hypothetical protein